MKKISGTEETLTLLNKIKKKNGKLIFIHSEGCCDGTSPLLVEEKDFYLGSQYIQVGEINEIPYYMHTANMEYWKYLDIEIKTLDGIGNSFSLESLEDKCFLIEAKKAMI